ncbi:Hypothetical protein NTJ_16094 [Nesidiocoris tenuis]|uniref:Uncharacterized protein n=1 Tax=Nesidiocoris tenuis TaxID=355587 RepID=A0ABN7BG14_9HEMI|nr:Hypothetical protein NTJ_16094 [Nesidiocoris tenuis]
MHFFRIFRSAKSGRWTSEIPCVTRGPAAGPRCQIALSRSARPASHSYARHSRSAGGRNPSASPPGFPAFIAYRSEVEGEIRRLARPPETFSVTCVPPSQRSLAPFQRNRAKTCSSFHPNSQKPRKLARHFRIEGAEIQIAEWCWRIKTCAVQTVIVCLFRIKPCPICFFRPFPVNFHGFFPSDESENVESARLSGRRRSPLSGKIPANLRCRTDGGKICVTFRPADVITNFGNFTRFDRRGANGGLRLQRVGWVCDGSVTCP